MGDMANRTFIAKIAANPVAAAAWDAALKAAMEDLPKQKTAVDQYDDGYGEGVSDSFAAIKRLLLDPEGQRYGEV